ncbi:MAG: CotH kinase family protein [Tannerella sp.]|jgi:hypothetical protein|nr:CotH kinase family protein [Tannerella sp.]
MKTLKQIIWLPAVCGVLLLQSCGDDSKDGTPPDDLPAVPLSSAEIKKYTLQIEQGGQPVSVTGIFSSDSSVITLTPASNHRISNIAGAVASFDADGRVRVNQADQVSGKTANDFRQDLHYTVTGENGEVKTYQVVLKSPQSTGLPVISIKTEHGAPITDKENYIPGILELEDPAHPSHNLQGRSLGIRGRGNTTWGNPKKPYRIKFDQKTSLFGLGAAKSWVLLANYQDPTFITNTVAFEIAHRLGLEYTNHANHVELFLNDVYCGNYLLTEQVEVNEYRVNIDEKHDFLVELDRHYDEDYKFKTPYLELPVNVKSPEFENESEMDFVIKSIVDLENALFRLTPDHLYSELIDVPALIDYMLLNEIVHNSEPFWPKSVFAHKRQDGKLKMGPVWDFDWGFGYARYGYTYFQQVEDLIYKKRPYDIDPPGVALFIEFFNDGAFVEAYRARWNEKKGKLSDIDQFVESMGAYLERSAVENEEEWPVGLDYSEQIAGMKRWLMERIDFLDREINKF